MSCTHNPKTISWPGGEAHLTANGNWWTTKRTPAGLEATRLDACPACGTKLWGLPAGSKAHHGDGAPP